ncbi:hemerythrin domain-containing protein [Mycolicibacter hiberniae]|uniref:Hemerythrin n=1 Tax=Mycolicibacter hiberniae TaxID=29314 RepID=A0A7I7X220_9MYCO|nr:hemerythrin domain-containing protein [Mycolicibacter hiberniae]MCV7085205.1 hemerythrin domain-containing protein [Mycolicibacter hiberniae]ORV70437.1 hemerythrin [Mycolicibacter hiberniae]BBZ23225.1 hemerythrin [Mycolicibacter hiberniae]
MPDEALSSTLAREHLLIDRGIRDFLDRLADGTVDAAGLSAALAVLRRHIYLEEQLLFPPISQGAHRMAVFGMIRGHGEIWRAMHALEELVQVGAGHTTLHGVSHRLLELLAAHHLVEERVIYAAADTGLAPDQAAELTEFLAGGQMPDGWICAKAA